MLSLAATWGHMLWLATTWNYMKSLAATWNSMKSLAITWNNSKFAVQLREIKLNNIKSDEITYNQMQSLYGHAY